MEKLSVALITKNEEKVIGQCLECLKWADEIVVLDGFSTDSTVEICQQYTKNIYQKEFESFPKERDFILKKTSHKWVLSVDADMYFPPEICEEIRDILVKGPKYDGYLCRGLTIFLDKEIRHCSWFDSRYLRFFNKEKGSYDLNYVALDLFYLKGAKGHLKNYFLHYAKESFIDYFGKIKRLSYLTALEYQNKGVKIAGHSFFWFFFSKPMGIFLYKYIWKRGFMDGPEGLIVCINSAISYYVAYAALWDIQRKE
jgi:glycosyltransferase involved in cell wall biosynthesis